MTDRTVKVSLVAQVQGYIQGMEKASKATQDTGKEAEKLAQKKEAFQQIGTAALAMGAVAAAGVAIAVKKFADWDAQMSQVQTLSHATADEMNQLRDASLNMGQAIGFSATQVADAETELVKAGVSVKDMLGGALTGALNLAAAGQINVAQATEIAAVALTQFKLQGKDVPHVADLLAAGADKALGGVDQLGQALNQGGLVAAQFGLTVDDTVGTLSAFANAGLLGSDAGTSFKQMLLSLASPSQKAADTMKQYNIQAYDAQGNFVGITNLAGQLQKNLGGVSQAQRDSALSIIFGSDAIRTANVLYKEGAKGIQGWINSVNDTGFAAEQARGKMDNLNGDVSKLGAALDTALIKTGSTANDILRGTVQGITALAQSFGDLPGPAQATILGVTALVAAVGLLGGGALRLVPMLANFRTALDVLGTSMRTVGIAGGAVGLAITGLVAIVAAVASAQAEAQARTDEFTASLDQNTGAITKNTRATAAKQLHDNGSIEAANKLGISLKLITDASLGNAKALDELNTKQDAFNKTKQEMIAAGKGDSSDLSNQIGSWTVLMSGIGATSNSLKDAKRELDNTNEAIGESADAADKATSSVQSASQSYLDAATSAGQLTDQISQLVDEINKANGVGQDAISSNASYQDALAKVQDTIQKVKDGADGYSSSLDENTRAGADNMQMFADLASRSQDAAKAQFDADHNTDAYIQRLQSGRQTLIDNITALTGNADAAKAIADRVYQIPDQKAVKVLTDTAEAQRALDDFSARLAEVTKTRVANIIVNATNPNVGFGLGDGHADGGYIRGPGGPREDRIPAMLSNGEFVVNAAATSRNLGLLHALNSGGVQGYASGGHVQPTYVPASSFASAPTVTVKTSDRPIYMDGQLFGMLREMANGEAQIVVNQNERAQARRTGMG